MTQPVATNGFVQQPAQTSAGTINIPAPVAPVDTAPATPAQNAPAASTDSALATAIAALTAALKPAGTPAAAPAGPEVPGVVDAGKGAPAQDLNKVDVNGLEDPILRSMALAMQAGAPNGLDMNRVLGLALERGDPSLIDRAYLIEKCGADAAQRIQIAEGIVASVNAKAEQSARTVYESAGGKEQWGAAAAAFNKAAPEALKAVVVTMLDSGNTEQVSAASKLVVEFAKGQGFVPTLNPLLSAGAGASAGQALSKVEFQEELRKLDPQSRDFQDRRGELFARRTLGKQLGK